MKIVKFFTRSILLVLLTTLFLNGTLYAGVTGKIAGKVTDVRTGEPIANVNIVVIEASLGAATNLDGEYFILNVSPGEYSISASHVNYASVTQQGVLVYVDLTSEVNFKLDPTIELREEVVIRATRPVIRKDVTASMRLTTGEEIYNMPVANFVGALANVAGAVGSGANIHIRGGRRGEVSYLIDGMEVKDPLLNERMLDIGSPAVAEMIAMTGGFDAEFGNAQSAVINVVTKEGGKEYHGRVKYIFDDLSPKPDPGFENISSFNKAVDSTVTTKWQPPANYQNYDYLEGSIGGPEPFSAYLLPHLGLKIPGYITMFLAADITTRNTTSNGMRINSSPWYKHDASGWLGLDQRREQTYLNNNLQLTYHLNPTMKIKVAHRSSNKWLNPYYLRLSRHFPYDYTQQEVNEALQAWTKNDSSYTYIPGVDDDGDGRVDEEALNGKDDDLDGDIDEDLQWYEFNAPDHTRLQKIDDEQFMLTWAHSISSRTYYHVKFSRYMASRQLRGGDKESSQYGEYKEPFTDLPGADGSYNGKYDPGEPFEDMDGDGIWDSGNQANESKNYNGFFISGDGLAGDVGQLVPAWVDEMSYLWGMKTQITSQMHSNHQVRAGLDLNYFDINVTSLPYPTIDNNGEGIYTDRYHVYPTDGALYLQDKMEFKDITLTIGSRLDFFMPGDQVRGTPKAFDPAVEADSLDSQENYVPFLVPKWVKMYVSPRLGASFAVTANAYLHAQYGHFYQRPRWDDLYTSVNQKQTGGTPLIGNPNLDPEKTVAFEVGISWNPYADYLIDVTGYLKDVKNWINTRAGKEWYPENFGEQLFRDNYSIKDNQDYAFARGLEFNFSKEYGSNLSGRVTYTLGWVNAKNSYSIGTQAARDNYIEPPRALPAGWDQRHSFVGSLGLRYGPNEHPKKMPWLPGNWQVNLLMSARSGLPYSPTDASSTLIPGQAMSKRTDWTSVIDLNLTKYFMIGRWKTSLWLEIRNLFDKQNIMHVDDNYGRAGAPDTFDDYTGEPGWVNDSSSPNFVRRPYAGPNPDAWDNPRFIRLGLGLDF